MISASTWQLSFTLVWIALCGLTVAACFLGARRALQCLLVCTLVSPVLSVGGQTIRIELVLVPVLLAAFTVSFPKQFLAAVVRPVSVVLVCWLGWVMLTGLINSGGRGAATSSWWTEAYGLGRLLIVFWLFSMFTWSMGEIVSLIRWLALTAIPNGILSVSQVLNAGAARAITATGFVPRTSPVFQQQLEEEHGGYIFRSLGVFGNVSPNAYYFAIVGGCCLLGLLGWGERDPARGKSLWLICGVFCLIGGMSTMSGTFIAGLPAIVGVAIWLSWKRMSFRRISLLLAVVTAMVVVTIVGVFSIPRLKIQYDYQVAGLLSGERFKSRYDDEAGVTRGAVEVISQNPVLGGFGMAQEVFIGDSIFTLLGFYGGYVGAGFFTLFVLLMLFLVPRQGANVYGTLWLLGAILFGISTTSAFTLRLSDWWWALMGIASTFIVGSGAHKTRPSPIRLARKRRSRMLQSI